MSKHDFEMLGLGLTPLFFLIVVGLVRLLFGGAP